MRKLYRAMQIVFALVLVVSLVGPARMASGATPAKAHPLLVQLAAEEPEQRVSVIVQKMVQSDRVEKLVAELGGQVTKDLHIINAFAAELSTGAALELSDHDGVRWVSPDGPVESAGKKGESSSVTHQTLTDEFNINAFDNNDGTQNWASPWMEEDPLGPGAASGTVQVAEGGLRLVGSPESGIPPSAAREADLGHAMTGPSLVFEFSFGPGVQSGIDRVVLEISSDSGLTYEPIITFGSYDGGDGGTFYGGIADYTSSHTRVRFRVLAGYDSPEDYFSVDGIEIGYDANPLSSGPAYNTYLDTLGVSQVWDLGYDGDDIGVAIIDSGINKEADFERRIKKQISFNTNSNTVNDTSGHGTHVAGIVGGKDQDYDGRFTGVAPGVKLLSLKISDEAGMAYESDMVEAMQWVLDNQYRQNIRVVNLSVNSAVESSYHDSPVNAAVEILWFNGIVVVASAGNSGNDPHFNVIDTAPANDPFIITVGASHEQGTTDRTDDKLTAFSAFCTTMDGFTKPEIIAPGKHIISVLSSQSHWYADHTDRVVLEEYFRISGTSMSAPMVTGAVALLLQAEPDLTPDQVKYRLMQTGSSIAGKANDPNDYSYLDVFAAVTTPTTESANTGLEASQLLWTGDEPVTWTSVAWNSVAWNSVAWNSVAWNSVAWNSVAWNSVAWN
ncbi:MAG: S8 family peptidase, partial [Anaerolineales bacterium]